MEKIGLIAGGGKLPLAVVQAAQAQGIEVFTAIIQGAANAADFPADSAEFHIGEFGKMTKAFKRAKCTQVCFAGKVERPDFRELKPDFKGMRHLPGALRAAKKGDDALLKYVVQTFEKDGFEIAAPQDICRSLLMPEGPLGNVNITAEYRDDTEKACKTAQAIGGLDIGQGAVVCRGLVLAVEAQEGTDAMLDRVAQLPENIRGSAEIRAGVFAKMVKPGQEVRVDLPTIGLSTIRRAEKAGLSGIAVEAGKCFVMDRDDLIDAADKAGMFVIGIPPSQNA